MIHTKGICFYGSSAGSISEFLVKRCKPDVSETCTMTITMRWELLVYLLDQIVSKDDKICREYELVCEKALKRNQTLCPSDQRGPRTGVLYEMAYSSRTSANG